MTAAPHAPRLSRATLAARGVDVPAPPVRIAHLGLGAFHRAHQAWYTHHAHDAADWGIAGFTGRSGDLAEALTPQDGVFTLVERGAMRDRAEHIGSIAAAYPASAISRLLAVIAAPETAIVTLTVTEAGYLLTPDGSPDLESPALAGDVALLRAAIAAEAGAAAVTDAATNAVTDAAPATVLGRLLAGLELRRRAGAGPLAIVPCDNFPSNGARLGSALNALAALVSPPLVPWLRDQASFVSTSVDRITPKVEASLVDTVEHLTGLHDAAPVATEPFTDWVLSGEFPAGRPAWEDRGARFVDEIEPYELRKLRLLNGAHSLLAYLGLLRGRATVAEAMADPVCAAAVEAWWDEAGATLPPSIEQHDYRLALAERFRNARIEHSLFQISADGATKLGVRVAPVARERRRAGRRSPVSALAVAAWIAAVQDARVAPDVRADDIAAALRSGEPAPALLRLVSPGLADDPDFTAGVATALRALRAGTDGVAAVLRPPS